MVPTVRPPKQIDMDGVPQRVRQVMPKPVGDYGTRNVWLQEDWTPKDVYPELVTIMAAAPPSSLSIRVPRAVPSTAPSTVAHQVILAAVS